MRVFSEISRLRNWKEKETWQERKKKEELKTYKVTVNGNPGYCGEGAGGAQFAHGEALITSERLAKWFGEHEGYTVTEIKTDSNDGTPGEQ